MNAAHTADGLYHGGKMQSEHTSDGPEVCRKRNKNCQPLSYNCPWMRTCTISGIEGGARSGMRATRAGAHRLVRICRKLSYLPAILERSLCETTNEQNCHGSA